MENHHKHFGILSPSKKRGHNLFTTKLTPSQIKCMQAVESVSFFGENKSAESEKKWFPCLCYLIQVVWTNEACWNDEPRKFDSRTNAHTHQMVCWTQIKIDKEN